MVKKKFKTASRKILANYGVNIAAFFWGSGNVVQTLASGLVGTGNETAAGIINLCATATGLARGHVWGLCPPLTISAVAMSVHQAPLLLVWDPMTWLAHGFYLLSLSPGIVEPWMQKRAARRLAEFKVAGRTFIGRSLSQTKQLVLKAYANPRVGFCVLGSAALFPMAIKEIIHGNYHLMPVYGMWLIGNVISAFSKTKIDVENRAAGENGTVRPGTVLAPVCLKKNRHP
ncbi:MAG: hypothetical protein PHY92_09970 [Alphaproteobacteria bacterium]|nr:hypothetical protein [Alphaproteobacteria bacterium]